MVIENEEEREQKLEKLRQDIVKDYCKVRPTSALAIIEEEMGVDVAVKMIDLFQGTIISIPTQSALNRAIMPVLIRRALIPLKAKADLFKKGVRQLSKHYKLPKRAIIEMYETGIFTR